MALRRLTIQEMTQLSSPWVTPGEPARTALERVPLLAPLLPQIEAAHRAIYTVTPQLEDPKARRLADEEAELDRRHDALVRAIYGTLTMMADLAPSGDELLRLRDELMPEGLEHTRKTYRGEAGHADMVASRLNDALRARLKAVTLHERTLLDVTEEWLATAKKLGELEAERARLGAPPPSPDSHIHAARLAWVRAVNALVAMAELAGLDSATDTLVFAALRAAERTADARGRRRLPAEPAEPEDVPVPPAAPANAKVSS